MLLAATATIRPAAVDADIKAMAAGNVGTDTCLAVSPRNSKNAQILLGVTPKRDFFRARKSIELADTLRVAENN